MSDEHFKWCKICDSHAELCIVEGTLRVLEIWEKESGEKRHDWTSSGLIYTPICEGCFEGLDKEIYRNGGIMELIR